MILHGLLPAGPPSPQHFKQVEVDELIGHQWTSQGPRILWSSLGLKGPRGRSCGS